MISIIIPVFNVEEYLSQCIDSIIVQTFSNFEIILIDDGSTDLSGCICDNYAVRDARVRVIHKKNGGVSTARNLGILEARGEWICFIDSDDFLASDFLENFHIEGNCSDIIIQGVELYHNQQQSFIKQVRVENKILEHTDFKQSVANNMLLHLGYPFAKLYRRRLLVDTRIFFNTDLSFHEDHIFVLQILNSSNTIQLVDSISYKYRVFQQANTLSQKRHPWRMLNESAEQMLLCLDTMKDRFLVQNSQYWKSIYSFAYYPKLEAVYELFRTNIDRNTRKNYFKTIIHRDSLNLRFAPLDFKHRLIKNVLASMPYFVIEAFLYLLIKWQDRNN